MKNLIWIGVIIILMATLIGGSVRVFIVDKIPVDEIPSASIQLAANNPTAIRPGVQVPLMRFQVDHPNDEVPWKEIQLNVQSGAETNAENFTLWWQNNTLISLGEKVSSQTVIFRFHILLPPLSIGAFEVRGDIDSPDGTTIKMSLDKSIPAYQGLPLEQSLGVLRP